MAKLSLQGQGTIVVGSGSVNPGSISAASGADVTISDANALVGDAVCVSPAADLTAGIVIASARVSANGTIKVRFANITGSSATQGAVTLNYTCARS